MKYWLIFTGLIMVNGVVWLTISDSSIESNVDGLAIESINTTKKNTVVDLPFQVINPEKITLVSESAMNNATCMLVGPFNQSIVATEMQRVLLSAKGIEFTSTKEPKQNILVYRVYIGPLGVARLNEVIAELNDVNVTDHYLFGINNAKAEKVISLGVYGYKENANAYANQLKKIGFETKVTAEKTEVSSRYWLSTTDDKIDDAVIQKEIEQVIMDESSKISGIGQIKVDIVTHCPL